MKRSLLIISALLIMTMFWGGCSKDIKGPARINQPPTVEFVNIPVEDARFSSDTAIYWYGTDVDGFIRFYRYAVVADSIVGPDPEAYIAGTPDNLIPWVSLEVALDNPHTKERVKLPADSRDPVRKYVVSVIFLQAIDNLGAKSQVVYRRFSKNNHFPETEIAANDLKDPYVNATTSTGVLEGVNISFSATDRIDYPRNPPPFEFRWRIYGPFDSLDMVAINHDYVESVFVDIYGDFYRKGDFYRTIQDIDTTIDTLIVPPDTTVDTTFNYLLVDTLRVGNPYGNWSQFIHVDSMPPTYQRLAEESHDPLANTYWISETSANIYDVFRYQSVPTGGDTTRLQYFLFWCQTRDDSKVPDPVPAYSWITVIEPKFERDVLVLDATGMGSVSTGNMNWPIFPGISYEPGKTFPQTTPPITRNVYGRLINAWKPGSFDTLNVLPALSIYDANGTLMARIDYPRFRCTQDYYQIGSLRSVPEFGIGSVSLRDILKHKIIILIKDSPSKQLPVASLEGSRIIKGLSAGMSAWSMARGPFATDQRGFIPELKDVPDIYTTYFGVDRIKWTAWFGMDIYFPSPGEPAPFGPPGQIRIEDFIGAISLGGGFPDLNLDMDNLEQRYLWYKQTPAGLGIFEHPFRCYQDSSILIGALPEVGYIEKTTYAEPLYLYNSKYAGRPTRIDPYCGIRVGNLEQYDGSVVACRYATPLFRTSHFCFSLLPFKESDVQGLFNDMMDWLSVQPYISTGKMAPASKVGFDIEKLRQINREFDELYKKGLLPGASEAE